MACTCGTCSACTGIEIVCVDDNELELIIDDTEVLVLELEQGVKGEKGDDGPVGPAGPVGPPGPSPGPLTFTAADTIAIGDLVTFDSAGDIVRASSSFSGGAWRVVGVAATAATSSSPVDVFTNHGSLAGMTFGSAPAASANGSLVFLDSTLGRATLTPPTAGGNTRTLVGELQGADGIDVSPNVIFFPQFISRIP